jgi:putative protease
MGCRRFVVDLSHLNAVSLAGRRILAAYAKDTEVPATSTFNYLQGMV